MTDRTAGKLHPALVLRKLPGLYDDWLICMISSQLHRTLSGYDEIVQQEDSDFSQSGLKVSSVICTTRLAVVAGDMLHGAIGKLTKTRLDRIRENIARWIRE